MARIAVSKDGAVSFVHDDDTTAALKKLGDVEIVRASHVEPIADGMWMADMAPSGGPELGPFETRAEALYAERQWLRQHKGL